MLVENINLYAREMKNFKFFKSIIKPLKEVGQIESIVAYGLGSMNDNLIAQYQFACALALRNELNINQSIEIFDPAMGKEDSAIASELGCEVIPHNEEAKRVALRKTLFFMPHCRYSLYNGLLWSNWGENMRNLFIVGNSFTNYSKTMSERSNLSKTNAMYPLLPYIREFPLEIDLCQDNKTPLPDVHEAFHDMSVHFFDDQGWQRASSSGLWENRPKEVIMGEVIDSGHNEELDKAIEDMIEHEEHEKELKESHEKILQGINSDEYYCSIDMDDEDEDTTEEKEEDSDSDDDDDDDMFENMYSGWGAQVGSMLKPDKLTPEWSLDASTVNAYTLGEKDPRKRIYVYNDEGVSAASKQMVVHTMRSFSDPAKYLIDTLDADEMKDQDWEDNAAMIIFPGGADMFYRKKLSAALGNGSNKRIRSYIENGGVYMGICAGSYYGSRKVEFDLHGPLEVNEERELKLFKGRAVGPALKGFSYNTIQGQYAIPFVFNEETPEGEVQRKGISYYKGGPYFIPDESSVVGKDYKPIMFYAKHPRLACPPGSLAGVSSPIRRGKAILLAAHVEFDPWLMRPTDDIDDITMQLRDPVLNQGRCRLIHKILKEAGIDMLPMKFMEPEEQFYSVLIKQRQTIILYIDYNINPN